MFVDLTGKSRVKLGLHTHTTLSDGRRSPEESAALYLEQGYDAIAITDHWQYGEEKELSGLKILPGIEYDVGGLNGAGGVFHIVGIGMTSDPKMPEDWRNMVKTGAAKAAEIIKRIHLHNGLAVLAHPAWSLNTPEMMNQLGDFDALEIYNAVSECGMSDRAYSDSVADMLTCTGKKFGLIAADDTHYYEGDFARGAIMVEATDMDTQNLVRAIKAGRFYATQGPEVHMEALTPEKVRVLCSPCRKVVFQTNSVWVQGRILRGENLVEATYSRCPTDTWVRAEVTDAQGRKAWTNYIEFGK